MNLYPLIMAPYFRSGKDTPWGGNMLGDAFMKSAPEQTGESLEVSVLPGCESLIREGSCAGKTLTAVAQLLQNDLYGAGVPAFPLQLKLIDVGETAPEADSVSAASTVLVILNCDAEAEITIGGTAMSVRPGDVYYVPAAVSYRPGSDMQIYAVSGTTETAPITASTERIFGTTSLCKGGSRTYYVSDSAIELCRLNIFGKMPLEDERMLVLMPLAPCAISCGDYSAQLMPFETVIIPAALTGVTVESDDCKILMASVSDRASLRTEMGYRAESIPGLLD